MKKTLPLVLGVLAVALLLGGCAQKAQAPTGQPGSAPQTAEEQVTTIDQDAQNINQESTDDLNDLDGLEQDYNNII